MKNIFPPFTKLVALAACALTLGSCSRAEYAMLPKGGSYHGVTRVATPVPASAPVAATPAAASDLAAPAVASTPVAEPAVAATRAASSATPAAPTSAPALAKKSRAAALAEDAPALGATSTIAATPAPKLNLVQRLTLNKVTNKVDKMMQKATARQHDNTAATSETSAISGNLRTGLIFLLVGLLVSLFSGISGIFGIIGAIFAIIGLVFIILWLLDQA